MDESTPCSAAKRIVIGTILYASCNGGAGAIYDFGDLNTFGGSLSVTPSSNSPICVGQILTLFTNASGLGSSSATFTWSGTGPGSYIFNSTLENPTESGLAAGTYTYTVTAADGSITNSNSIEIIVGDSPAIPVNGGNQSICSGATIPALTATVGVGETVDWYDTATGGSLLLGDNTSYTPTTAGSYFAEARNTTTNCVSSSRTEIILTISGCTVITNRRITYRVKRN